MSNIYDVTIPIVCWVTVSNIDAEDAEDAEEKAFSTYEVSAFCGNGGNDKLIGVTESDQSIEVGDYIDMLEVDVCKQ